MNAQSAMKTRNKLMGRVDAKRVNILTNLANNVLSNA
jgi:hypothetical protein